MNNLNSMLNQHQNSSLQQEIHNQDHFDLVYDDIFDQLLSSFPSSAAWPVDQSSALLDHFADQSAAKMRQHQIAKALMLQQQLMLSAAGGDVALSMPNSDHNDVVDHSSFSETDASSKALINGFTELNQSQHFHNTVSENFRAAAAVAPAISQAAASDSGGGGAAGQPRQKVRARRGQATDPHSIAERLRRERIAERMKGLQELVPNANKTDKASMLDEIIDYVKFLRLQVKVLSMSRLGGAAAVPPLLGDTSSQGKGGGAGETASTSKMRMRVSEQKVAKLMEDDMGAAMQYLQGKGLCLMPISLATSISTPGEPTGPTSPTMSL